MVVLLVVMVVVLLVVMVVVLLLMVMVFLLVVVLLVLLVVVLLVLLVVVVGVSAGREAVSRWSECQAWLGTALFPPAPRAQPAAAGESSSYFVVTHTITDPE
ncbi:hypothetical protein FHG87_022123 [Trinorchestia longiramus]|nr:hypothetical protein FHG87_022123 [Trinorchestia longiramus]